MTHAPPPATRTRTWLTLLIMWLWACASVSAHGPIPSDDAADAVPTMPALGQRSRPSAIAASSTAPTSPTDHAPLAGHGPAPVMLGGGMGEPTVSEPIHAPSARQTLPEASPVAIINQTKPIITPLPRPAPQSPEESAAVRSALAILDAPSDHSDQPTAAPVVKDTVAAAVAVLSQAADQPPAVPASLAGVPASLPAVSAIPYSPELAGLVDVGVVPVECSGCGTGRTIQLPESSIFGGRCTTCGQGRCACKPGVEACEVGDGSTMAQRLFLLLYECLCCPDPCYVPRWTGLANAAFFVEGARPVTQTRFRYDAGINLIFPDRAEYFFPRADGLGKYLPAVNSPFRGIPRVNYQDLGLYTEGATAKVGVYTTTSYRSVDPFNYERGAGFGDLSFGTKTLLFDSELLIVAMQFTTYTPTGNFLKGVGNGHVSLEPGLLLGLKLAPQTYLQAQIAEWIPLGGDPNYAGAILHYHLSLNQMLAQPVRDAQIIGTLEFSGWSFQNGQYTDPVLGANQQASGATYLYLGPGLRFNFCDKLDFGVGAQFALGSSHFAEQLIRTEFRYRY